MRIEDIRLETVVDEARAYIDEDLRGLSAQTLT